MSLTNIPTCLYNISVNYIQTCYCQAEHNCLNKIQTRMKREEMENEENKYF